MADLPTPTASRLKRPSWKDGRFVVGLLLVLVATIFGSLMVARADDRVPMYAAAGSLLPGEQLTSDRLTRLDVQLADGTAAYLPATQSLGPDTYVLREVRPGELVPKSALGSKDDVHVQPVTLMVDVTSASALVVGSVVDVYVNPPVKGGTAKEFSGPQRALEGVSVTRIAKTSGALGASTSTQAVQVMAPREKVQGLIAQVDVGARITVVPVPGSRVRDDQ